MANPFNSSKSTSVSSRFVSSNELTDAQKQREQDLKAAYERIGQEPPPQPVQEEYDPRSLYERLKANKDAKQEKFDETFKLSNQFRGIDESESDFLADVAKEKREQERQKAEEERKELDEFRKRTQSSAVSPHPAISPEPKQQAAPAKSSPTHTSPPPPSAAAGVKRSAPSSIPPPKSHKKKRDGALLGIRKKPTAAASPKNKESGVDKSTADGSNTGTKASFKPASGQTSTSTT